MEVTKQFQRLSEATTQLLIRTNNHARRQRKTYAALGILIFVTGILVSVFTEEIKPTELRTLPLVLNIFVIAPLALITNAWGLMLNGRLLSTNVSFINALRSCSYGSATSILPLPTGLYFQLSELTRSGATAGRSTGVIALSNFFILAFFTIFAGIAWITYFPKLGTVVAVLGFFGSLLVIGIVYHVAGARAGSLFLGLRLLRVTILVTRVWTCFAMLDYPITFPHVAALSGAVLLGTLTMIFPAGIGVSEAISAALASTISIAPATAFLATAINRSITILVASVISVFLFTPKWYRPAP